MYKDCHKETVKSRRKIDTIVFKIISKIDIQWQKQTLCGLNRYHSFDLQDSRIRKGEFQAESDSRQKWHIVHLQR